MFIFYYVCMARFIHECIVYTGAGDIAKVGCSSDPASASEIMNLTLYS